MPTLSRYAAVLTLVAVAGPLTHATADEKAKPGQPVAPTYLVVPGYPSLGMANVPKEIGLSEAQIDKLRAISKKVQQVTWKQQPQIEWAKLSAAERKTATETMTQNYKKWAAEYQVASKAAQKEVEALLTPAQVTKLRAVELRQFAAPMLLYGQVGDKLKLTARQKEQLADHKERLQKRLAELQDQIRQTQDQANRAALELLTAEQRESLQKMKQDGFGWGRVENPGATPKKEK